MMNRRSSSIRFDMRLPQRAACLFSAVAAARCRRVSGTPTERRGYSPSPTFRLQPSAYSLSPRAGLSLIELLSSLTILVIMIGLLAIVLNNATDVWGSTRSRSRLIVQGRTALETIGQDLRQAVVNTNSYLSIERGDVPIATPYAATNNWILFVRLLTTPATNQFAFEEVAYGAKSYSNRCVLGRWTHRWNQTDSLTLSSPDWNTISTTIGPDNIVIDALASFLVETNWPCIDISLALLDPNDARTATGIASANDQKSFIERHAVHMSRRIYLPAQTPGGLP